MVYYKKLYLNSVIQYCISCILIYNMPCPVVETYRRNNILCENNIKIILVKRSDNQTQPFYWPLPYWNLERAETKPNQVTDPPPLCTWPTQTSCEHKTNPTLLLTPLYGIPEPHVSRNQTQPCYSIPEFRVRRNQTQPCFWPFRMAYRYLVYADTKPNPVTDPSAWHTGTSCHVSAINQCVAESI
jgi:hypothetical protein